MLAIRRCSVAVVLLLSCAKASPIAPAPPPTIAAAAPPPQCNRSAFVPTADGVVWSIGGQQVRFRATEETGELAYNYRRRTVRIDAVDGGAFIASSCYAETDCGAPPDADGDDRWCLATHGLEGAHTLFDLIAPHRPCESPIELLEALAAHATAPACLRVALGTYPGAAYDQVGFLEEDLATQGVPPDVITAVIAHAKAAEDLDSGVRDPAEQAAAAAALRDLRQAIAPYLALGPAWKLDLLAARALATLERRYPATLVGPDEALDDVVSTDPWQTVPTPAPWARR